MTSPINIKKIIIATTLWLLLHYKKILMVSLVPFILITPFVIALWGVVGQITQTEALTIPEVSISFVFYFMMALIGYFLMAINIYRLVLNNHSGGFSIELPKTLPAFIMSLAFIQVLLTVPVVLTGTPALYLITYMFVVPLVLNLPRIAIGLPKQSYKLPIQTRLQLTIIQALVPVSVILLASVLLPSGAIGTGILLVLKLVLNYWEMIAVVLSYQAIEAHTQSKNS